MPEPDRERSVVMAAMWRLSESWQLMAPRRGCAPPGGLIEQGVDWIMIMLAGGLCTEHETVENPQFTEDKLTVVMRFANGRDIAVAAHCGSSRVTATSARAGRRSLEHGYALDEESAAVHRTWLVSTIGVTHDTDTIIADNRLEHARSGAVAAARSHADGWRARIEAGVGVATGPDLNLVGHDATSRTQLAQCRNCTAARLEADLIVSTAIHRLGKTTFNLQSEFSRSVASWCTGLPVTTDDRIRTHQVLDFEGPLSGGGEAIIAKPMLDAVAESPNTLADNEGWSVRLIAQDTDAIRCEL